MFLDIKDKERDSMGTQVKKQISNKGDNRAALRISTAYSVLEGNRTMRPSKPLGKGIGHFSLRDAVLIKTIKSQEHITNIVIAYSQNICYGSSELAMGCSPCNIFISVFSSPK